MSSAMPYTFVRVVETDKLQSEPEHRECKDAESDSSLKQRQPQASDMSHSAKELAGGLVPDLSGRLGSN